MTEHLAMASSEEMNHLAAALAQAQGEFPIVEKNKTAKVRDWGAAGPDALREYKYADLADVLRGVLPILSKHKLAVLQPTHVEAGTIFLRTRIVHVSGQWIECEYPVCAINVDHQKMGSALTYAKRYALCALLGVAAEEDTDGALAGAVTLEIKRPVERLRRARPAPTTSPHSQAGRLPPLVSKPVLPSSKPRSAARAARTSSANRTTLDAPPNSAERKTPPTTDTL